MDQGQAKRFSARRLDAGPRAISTINKMTLTNNQCGIGHGGFPIVIAVTDSDISRNGLKANTGALLRMIFTTAKNARRLTLT